jgi:hypothetical protein
MGFVVLWVVVCIEDKVNKQACWIKKWILILNRLAWEGLNKGDEK